MSTSLPREYVPHIVATFLGGFLTAHLLLR